MSGTQPIATLELNEPLEWRPHRDHVVGIPKCAELLLPEGKGWGMPEVEWEVEYKRDLAGWSVVPSYIGPSVDLSKDAIIELRYPDGRTERVRVVDVLGVETDYEVLSALEDEPILYRKVPCLRCVVVPA